MNYNNVYKNITIAGMSYRLNEFKNDESMTEKLPSEMKSRILSYLTSAPVGLVGDVRLTDPVTGKSYTHTSVCRNKDGFEWSSADIYMFEHYDVKLSEDFLQLFKESR